MKRRVFILCWLFGLILLIGMTVRSALSLDWPESHERLPLLTSVSPGKKVALIVEYDSASFFSPSSVYVFYTKGDQVRKPLLKTSIANDGRALFPENCHITWNGQVAFVTFHGKEQADEVYKVDLSERATVVKIQ